MERFEDKCNVVMLGGFSHSTGEGILNRSEAVYLGDVYVEVEKRLAQEATMQKLNTG